MEPKKRLLIALAVIVLIAGAVLTSFGRSIFALSIPDITLPDTGELNSSISGSQPNENLHQRIEITPKTVQSVIATLERPASYYRELTVETIWDGGSSTSTVQIWVDKNWSHSRKILPSGIIRHDLVGEDVLYYWYEGSQLYNASSADALSADLSQRIPTYETVLEIETNSITAAGYELRGEMPCIYVEVAADELSKLSRYWIGVDSGLLVSAEMEQNEQLVYYMTAYSPIAIPCPPSDAFQLPDGQLLHAVSE